MPLAMLRAGARLARPLVARRLAAPAGSPLRWCASLKSSAPAEPPPPLERLAPPQWVPSYHHQYAVPSPWLGAYYSLRKDNEAAQRKVERLCGRRAPSRGIFIVQTLERQQMRRIMDKEPWRRGQFRGGDFLEVEHRPSMSEPPERIVGLVLAKHKKGLATSFYLLCHIDGVPVEYKFKLFSPLLLSVEVRGKFKKQNRTKIYYMRDRLKEISFPSLKTPAGGQLKKKR